jgi:hypothetical protein
MSSCVVSSSDDALEAHPAVKLTMPSRSLTLTRWPLCDKSGLLIFEASVPAIGLSSPRLIEVTTRHRPHHRANRFSRRSRS